MNDDRRIIRIEDKVDSIKDTLGEINVTIAAQHESLKAHMARTDALEAIVIPLNRESYMVRGVLKAVGVLALMAAIAEGGVALLTYLRSIHP